MAVTLASYNIQYGTGRDGLYDLARAIEAVKDADIIALQEVERNWKRSGMSDQPAAIAELMLGAPVTSITGTSRSRLRISRNRAMPSSPGMPMSETTASNCLSASRRTAELPSW